MNETSVNNNIWNTGKLLNIKKLPFSTFFTVYGKPRYYNKNNIIFHYEDNSNNAYYIKDGKVKTYKLTPEGKEVTFEILNSGEILGLAEVLFNCQRIRYAKTMCKTILLVIDKEQLLNLIFSKKEFNTMLISNLIQKILEYQEIIEDLATLPVRQRLLNLLLRLSKTHGRQIKDYIIIDLTITHEEIAKMIGSSRETVTIILNELRTNGIIDWEKKKFKIYVTGTGEYTGHDTFCSDSALDTAYRYPSHA